ncbi:MAG: hypothetical protein ABI231_02390 [Candidatus Tumulicola sp.]
MAAKKSSRKKSATKSSAKRAPTSAKTTAKKIVHGGKSLVKKATSAASKAARKTKQLAQGAQEAGKIMGVIGNLIEAGGKAAEDLTAKVKSGGPKVLARSRKPSGTAKSGTRKKR